MSIPPWSDPIHDAVARYLQQLAKVKSRSDLETLLRVGNYPELEAWTVDEVFAAVSLQLSQGSTTDLLWPEWNAFVNPVPSGAIEFETALEPAPPSYSAWLESTVLVRRLREVRALFGFTRISEPDPAALGGPRLVGLAERPSTWLPASEMRGEGIFLRLKEERLRRWEAAPLTQEWHKKVATAFAGWRARRSLSPIPAPAPRFVLLHSLSHALIRQLGLDCGYSSGSIRERLYCSVEPGRTMAGVLLYTGTTDSDGSLGGLVELGRGSLLDGLLREALAAAGFCASDPLCADNTPGTNESPNGAACHACLLASETSCENNNRLLDRSALVQTVAGSVAFFGQVD